MFQIFGKIDDILNLTAVSFHSCNATQNISEQEDNTLSRSTDDILIWCPPHEVTLA